jgi:hypothetical protein
MSFASKASRSARKPGPGMVQRPHRRDHGRPAHLLLREFPRVEVMHAHPELVHIPASLAATSA